MVEFYIGMWVGAAIWCIINKSADPHKSDYADGYHDGYQSAINWINGKLDVIIKKQEENLRELEKQRSNGIL